MKNKVIRVDQAVAMIQDGDSVMIGGFMSCGTPETIIDKIVEARIKELYVIANDSGVPKKGIGKLITAKAVSRLTASHIGLNPETGAQMVAGDLQVELIPQGSLAEKIRAGGAGLGGVLTTTGIGTEVEAKKTKLMVDEVEYILETPIRARVALIKGTIVDCAGNVFYHATTKNFNPCMATAADLVIVEADKIVEVGEIDPDYVMTPSIFVDYIVAGGKSL